MKSLTERDEKHKENWYIACLSRELGKTPIARTIYDKSYVLFRDEAGNPVCFLNRCLHRLTQLETGEVKNGCLKCPYHGWTYDKEGNVVHIPSEGAKDVERKLQIEKRKAIEQDGVVWIWMGDETPSADIPPWRFPHWEDSSWVKYFMITDFNNEVTNLCENFMDVPHTVFVHKGWFRNQSQKFVPMQIETKNARVLVTYKQEEDKIGGLFHWLLNPKGHPMKHTDEFIYPNLTRVDYTFGENYGFIINSQNTPVSTLKSRTYTYIAYKMAIGSKIIKPFIQYYTRQVIEQDVDIMEIQGRSLKIDPTENFQSTEADALHIEIEKLRRWGKVGDPKLHSYTNLQEKGFWI